MGRHTLSWMVSVIVTLCLFSVAVANQDEPESQHANLTPTINQPMCSRPGTFTPSGVIDENCAGSDTSLSLSHYTYSPIAKSAYMKITYSSNNDNCDYHIQTKRINVYGVGSASGYLYRTSTAMVNGLSPSIVFAVNARDTVNKFNDAIGAHLSSYALPTIHLGAPQVPIAISWTPHFRFLWANWYGNFPKRNTYYTQAVSETHHPNSLTYVRELFYLDVMTIIKAPFNIDPARFMYCEGRFSYTLQAGSDHGDWDWYPIGN